jgi:hypothetical protein
MSDVRLTDVNLEEPEFVEGDAGGPSDRARGGRGTVVMVTTVVALVVATALTVLGLGAADSVVDSVDSSSWMWSANRGEVGRVNGVTARVDTRAKILDAQNHEIQITQNDRYLILRDLETGQVTALDLTTLQISAVMPTTPGIGVSVELYGDVAMVIDGVQGVVRQLDPRTLSPAGEPVTLRRGIVSGGFDTLGSLWVGLPSEGTVVAIQPGTDGAGPRVTRTHTVADPAHDLVLSSLDTGVAVLDNTTQRLAVVIDRVDSVALPTRRPGIMPAHTTGRPIAVTIPTERAVLLVDGQAVRRVSVAGTGAIGPAVAYAGRVYVPDPSTGAVRVVTTAGQVVNTISIPSASGRVELEVRENYLFINSPDGPDARVVDSDHRVRDVEKYQDGVLGGDPPPPLPVPEPPQPRVTEPGPPQAVTATAGDGSVTITWRRASENGAPITQYVVEGQGAPVVVGASQRQAQITGLTNGQTYRFSVHAVNEVGPGPRAWTRNIVPTRDVPDAPASIQAFANPDGSVSLTWPPANGQGRPILQYRVTSISGGGVTASVGSVTDTTMIVPSGALTYGTQYVFTVVAINDLDAGSAESPASNAIVPFTTPGAPAGASAWASPTQPGTVDVSWQAAPSNGSPVLRYEVAAAGALRRVDTGTSLTLTGLPDDTVVPVRVRALNAAGPGPFVTVTARTMGMPTVTVTGTQGDYNSVSVTMTPDNRGGAAQCTLDVAGAGSVNQSCNTAPLTLTVSTNVWPNNGYDWTVTITNPLGSTSSTSAGSGPIATTTLLGTSICGDPAVCAAGEWAYASPAQSGSGLLQLAPGATVTPQCRVQGGAVTNPTGGKAGGGNPDPLANDHWLRFTSGGQTAYFPWAWTLLDGGDVITRLPTC